MVRLEDGAGGHGRVVDGKSFGGVIYGLYLVAAGGGLEKEISGGGGGEICVGGGGVGGKRDKGGGAIKHIPVERSSATVIDGERVVYLDIAAGIATKGKRVAEKG